jgi:hypothetical protein
MKRSSPSLRSFLVGLVPLALAAVAACGQDAATCSNVCGLTGAPSNCATVCAAQQTLCTADGHSGDFQAYLTCLENTGVYDSQASSTTAAAAAAGYAANASCAAEASALVTGCATGSSTLPTPTPGSDAGSSVDASTGFDSGLPTTGCPASTAVVTLGEACSWAGTCTVNLQACGPTQGTLSIGAVCQLGAVSLPPGEGVACAGTTGGGSGTGSGG